MSTLSRLTPLLAIMALSAGCDSRARRAPNDTVARPSVAPTSTAATASCAGQVVFGDRVGPIHVGMSLDALQRVCAIVHDTTVPVVSGPAERRVSVLLGSDTAVVALRISRVQEILLTSGSFRTADSIGIGTPLRVLLARDSVKAYGTGGQLLVSSPSECGLTFGIAGRYPDLPDGAKDSATVARVPQSAVVDRVRIDGCESDDEGMSAADDSTYDIQTDSVLLSRDLDGNGRTDYVVRESRPYRRTTMYIPRLAIYLDSFPAGRHPRWSSGWDMEGETTFREAIPLGSHASMLEVDGNTGDYTSEALLAIRNDSIIEELAHGEDYGQGFLETGRDGATLVVDASQMHLMLRGAPVSPELECEDGNWPAVRMRWNEASRRFVLEKPRCVKAR